MNMDSKSDLKVYDGEQFDKDLCKVVGEYGSHSFQFKKLGRLPDELTRVRLTACFFWRILANQVVFTHLPELHREFCQSTFHHELRRVATWLLSEAESVMPPSFTSSLAEHLTPAMRILVSRYCSFFGRSWDFDRLRERVLTNDHDIASWSRGTPLLKAAHKALHDAFSSGSPRRNPDREEQVPDNQLPPDALRMFRRPCPQWLSDLPATLSQEVLEVNLRDLFKDSLVYPGAGHDWSPIRQLDGVIHSFLFFDPYKFQDRLREFAYFDSARRLFPRYPNVRTVGMVEMVIPATHFTAVARKLPQNQFTGPAPELVSCPRCNHQFPLSRQPRSRKVAREKRLRNLLENHGHYGGDMLQPDDYLNSIFWGQAGGRGFWVVYELEPGRRVSLLYLEQEAIMGLALLGMETRRSPKALVLQDHGLGGNHWWSTLGQPYHRLLMEKLGVKAPRFLVIGDDNYNFIQNTGLNYQPLADDISWESMARNKRTFYKLKPPARD